MALKTALTGLYWHLISLGCVIPRQSRTGLIENVFTISCTTSKPERAYHDAPTHTTTGASPSMRPKPTSEGPENDSLYS